MLASVDDLRNHMGGVTFSTAERLSAKDVISGVQQELERYINRPVEPVLKQERIQADTDGTLQFSYTPVQRLLSVTDQYGYVVPVHMNNGSNSGTPVVAALTDADMYDAGTNRREDSIGDSFYGDTVIGYGVFGANMFVYPGLYPGFWYAVRYVAGLIGYANDDIKLAILRVAEREMRSKHDDTKNVQGGAMSDKDSAPPVIGWQDAELAKFDRLRRRVIA